MQRKEVAAKSISADVVCVVTLCSLLASPSDESSGVNDARVKELQDKLAE